jgi:hypothetical protein
VPSSTFWPKESSRSPWSHRRFLAGPASRRREISHRRPISGQADLARVLRVRLWSTWTPPPPFSRAGAPSPAGHRRCLGAGRAGQHPSRPGQRGLPVSGPRAPPVSALGHFDPGTKSFAQ